MVAPDGSSATASTPGAPARPPRRRPWRARCRRACCTSRPSSSAWSRGLGASRCALRAGARRSPPAWWRAPTAASRSCGSRCWATARRCTLVRLQWSRGAVGACRRRPGQGRTCMFTAPGALLQHIRPQLHPSPSPALRRHRRLARGDRRARVVAPGALPALLLGRAAHRVPGRGPARRAGGLAGAARGGAGRGGAEACATRSAARGEHRQPEPTRAFRRGDSPSAAGTLRQKSSTINPPGLWQVARREAGRDRRAGRGVRAGRGGAPRGGRGAAPPLPRGLRLLVPAGGWPPRGAHGAGCSRVGGRAAGRCQSLPAPPQAAGAPCPSPPAPRPPTPSSTLPPANPRCGTSSKRPTRWPSPSTASFTETRTPARWEGSQ